MSGGPVMKSMVGAKIAQVNADYAPEFFALHDPCIHIDSDVSDSDPHESLNPYDSSHKSARRQNERRSNEGVFAPLGYPGDPSFPGAQESTERPLRHVNSVRGSNSGVIVNGVFSERHIQSNACSLSSRSKATRQRVARRQAARLTAQFSYQEMRRKEQAREAERKALARRQAAQRKREFDMAASRMVTNSSEAAKAAAARLTASGVKVEPGVLAGAAASLLRAAAGVAASVQREQALKADQHQLAGVSGAERATVSTSHASVGKNKTGAGGGGAGASSGEGKRGSGGGGGSGGGEPPALTEDGMFVGESKGAGIVLWVQDQGSSRMKVVHNTVFELLQCSKPASAKSPFGSAVSSGQHVHSGSLVGSKRPRDGAARMRGKKKACLDVPPGEERPLPMTATGMIDMQALLDEYELLTFSWCRYCGARCTSTWQKSPWGRKKLCTPHYSAWSHKQKLALPEREPTQPVNPMEISEYRFLHLVMKKYGSSAGVMRRYLRKIRSQYQTIEKGGGRREPRPVNPSYQYPGVNAKLYSMEQKSRRKRR